jgi:hypothetical protein
VIVGRNALDVSVAIIVFVLTGPIFTFLLAAQLAQISSGSSITLEADTVTAERTGYQT